MTGGRQNPWLVLNPVYANIVLLLFVCVVLIIDCIMISLHWNTNSCSTILKLWIIGKYVAPLLSYMSCCLFIPCNMDEALEVSSAIPYSQYELRQRRIRQSFKPSVLLRCIIGDGSVDTIPDIHEQYINQSSIANEDKEKNMHIFIVAETAKNRNIENNEESATETSSMINIPYPYDVLLSEWCISPSHVTSLIIESLNNSMDDSSSTSVCFILRRVWIYFIGILFDRGILELIWLFVGIFTLLNESSKCSSRNPVIFFYVSLQVFLGFFITILLSIWMISSTFFPLQVMHHSIHCY